VKPRMADGLQQIRARIKAQGAVALPEFMAAAVADYYAAGNSFGAAGDFTTAPEISQMFGEIIGAWAVDAVSRFGYAHYVELGPGRGTLAQDALRVAARGGWQPQAHFVETSPALQEQQCARFPHAQWHASIETLPTDAPLLIIANEFFDALPVAHYVRCGGMWRERQVALAGEAFTWCLGAEDATPRVPSQFHTAPEQSVWEYGAAAVDIARDLAARLAHQGGAMLVLDYGYSGPALGETLQALRAHVYAPVLEAAGVGDITAHVDFTALATAVAAGGAQALPLRTQGDWLEAHGISHRAKALIAHARAQGQEVVAAQVAAAHTRLVAAEQMGGLFKILEVRGGGWLGG
jgi:NADH dehydrogenase [ubiquinone] 1 alpha subcomplex assembly factor 7